MWGSTMVCLLVVAVGTERSNSYYSDCSIGLICLDGHLSIQYSAV